MENLMKQLNTLNNTFKNHQMDEALIKHATLTLKSLDNLVHSVASPKTTIVHADTCSIDAIDKDLMKLTDIIMEQIDDDTLYAGVVWNYEEGSGSSWVEVEKHLDTNETRITLYRSNQDYDVEDEIITNQLSDETLNHIEELIK